MDCIEAYETIKTFPWDRLKKLYGSGHATIIGFLASEWLSVSPTHAVVDGPPGCPNPKAPPKRYQADLMLCNEEIGSVIVEVETCRNLAKINSLRQHIMSGKPCFPKSMLSLFVTSNVTSSKDKYHHAWNEIERKIAAQIQDGGIDLAVVSISKTPNYNISSSSCRYTAYARWDVSGIQSRLYDRDILKSEDILYPVTA